MSPDGRLIEQLGRSVGAETLANLKLSEPEVERGKIQCEVVDHNRFGNVQLNLTKEHLGEAEVHPGARVELELAGQRFFAIAARTFSDARTGDLILYEDSYGNVAVAMNGGSAAQTLNARAGQDVRINLDIP